MALLGHNSFELLYMFLLRWDDFFPKNECLFPYISSPGLDRLEEDIDDLGAEDVYIWSSVSVPWRLDDFNILFSEGERGEQKTVWTSLSFFRQVDLHKLASSTFTHAFKVFSFLCTLLKLEVNSKALCSLEPVTYEKGLVQLLRHSCDALNIIFVGWAKWTLYGSPLPLEFAPLIAVGETYLPSG